MAKVAIAEIKGQGVYSQSRFHDTPKLSRELPAAYEERTWRNKMHVDDDGFIFIPPMAFKNCLSECAKYLGLQVPGKGKANYTKHFEAGIQVLDEIPLDIKPGDVSGKWLLLPSDGKRGGGKRVKKCLPEIKNWNCKVRFYIYDDIITKDIFLKHLNAAGQLIGIGTFRPRNNGYWGRFKVVELEWKDGIEMF